MKDKLLLLLAFDALLMEMDNEYVSVPDESAQLIESKVFESYGLKVTASDEEVKEMRKSFVQDIKKYRDSIFNEIKQMES